MKIGSGPETTTYYVVDKNRDYAQVLEERDAAGTLAVRYVYGLDLIAQVRGTNPSYYHYDGLGSTRQLTDASASAPTDTYTYEAFGRVVEQTHTGSTATPNDYLYTGEQYDQQSGQYYLRARYYQPGTGRFTGRDAAEGYTSDPITLHKYLYGGADPVNQLDPGGDEFALVGSLCAISIQNMLASVQATGGRAVFQPAQSALQGHSINQAILSFAISEVSTFVMAVGIAVGLSFLDDLASAAFSGIQKFTRSEVRTAAGLVTKVRRGIAGRTESVFARLETPLKKGSPVTEEARAQAQAMGRASDDAGHLVAESLGGGGGKKSGNIVPMNRTMNRGELRVYEQEIKKLADEGREVYYSVKPQYRGSETRPYAIVYQVRVDGKTLPPRVFNNP